MEILVNLLEAGACGGCCFDLNFAFGRSANPPEAGQQACCRLSGLPAPKPLAAAPRPACHRTCLAVRSWPPALTAAALHLPLLFLSCAADEIIDIVDGPKMLAVEQVGHRASGLPCGPRMSTGAHQAARPGVPAAPCRLLVWGLAATEVSGRHLGVLTLHDQSHSIR